jgi:hypothetical protein
MPLSQAVVLQQVLAYVGPGHWLMIAQVSQLWKQVYEQLGGSAVRTVPMLSGLYGEVQMFDCHLQMTLLQAVFASPSVLRTAHAAGLPLEDSARLQRAAGFFADQNTLLAAYELGLKCTGSVVNGIAASGCLHKVSHVCSRYPRQILDESAWYAASSGSIDMLKLMQQQSVPVFEHHTLRVAERHSHFEVYEYIAHRGPESRILKVQVEIEDVRQQVAALRRQVQQLV